MHEFFIVQNVIRTVEDLMVNHPKKKVVKAVLLIGRFSGVEPELLQTALDFFKQGSVLKDAEIVIEIEDLRMRCQKCQQEFSKEKWDLTCPFCGSFETEVLSGEEMLLKSLELVDED
ncbi:MULTISPECIES: hydrogenase maturation nickel metallochaperone HypA [Thermodesulfobacterium]|jgi:hydrogenase nickel incorporation protein HypA/HybF|uniref:Hydrogenase maturation factor HypA n=1 Tax=Thermodesulfobacterium commune TaxID=1741 RepID=A0A101FI74_9BACT|nr:hydrogenase maturation nickel metallochaperone HypA [Thermodesulfobacterium sp.]KUJ97539.1 MAG: Hydrogenase nickel insertion protein HypA [Thermodesulfobacterium sp. 37_54]KUK19357.1 MAG: Hydrogenase nickel insertion protein HypA [Thermodesulfobacterium commune]KUK37482.1 MAG: Hydrogenase nickel insertion protein HypA [Thermodesulfobacterium commune]MBZ4681324.1 hydrogenase nickel incorporation protein HypA [Thermodesulfobacterium sp.]MDK2860842.1 hydrogenase nickel incorporation protein Hy